MNDIFNNINETRDNYELGRFYNDIDELLNVIINEA